MTSEKHSRFTKAVSRKFTWIPPHARMSRFGGPASPRQTEERRPILWLARDGNELYLVNAGNEVLKRVIIDNGGFLTVDDDVAIISSKSPIIYENIQPGESVKVDEYDGFYDLDYSLHVQLGIESSFPGHVTITSPAQKGGVNEMVLLWDSGEPGKHVDIKEHDAQ